MKTRVQAPFIGQIQVEVEPGIWRKMWSVTWRGEEYAKYNTYDAAKRDCDNLGKVDNNARRG